MSLGAAAIVDAVISHALATGQFARVNGFEPKSAPGSGLTAAVWADTLGPYPAGSGLAQTSGRVVLKIRLYTSMLSEPQDAIDPALLDAVDVLMAAYSGDFTLGGLVRNVDLLGAAGGGAAGAGLTAQAGYLNASGQLMRIMDISLPVLVNDLWSQSP
jgi:hypothetical protein